MFKRTIPEIKHLAGGFISISHKRQNWVLRTQDFLDSLLLRIGRVTEANGRRRFCLQIRFETNNLGQSVQIYTRPGTFNQAMNNRRRLLDSLQAPSVEVPPGFKPKSYGLWKSAFFMAAGLALGWYLFYPIEAEIEVAQEQEKVEAIVMDNLRAIASQAGVPVMTGREYEGKKPLPFYVLSRPGCDDCSPADLALSKLSTDFLPIIIPTGFEDKKEQIYAVSHVYCAQNPDEKWMSYVKSKDLPNEAATCEWSERAMLAAAAGAFTELVKAGDSRPIIVAPNGAVFRGKLNAPDPVPGLSQWLYANEGAPTK